MGMGKEFSPKGEPGQRERSISSHSVPTRCSPPVQPPSTGLSMRSGLKNLNLMKSPAVGVKAQKKSSLR